MDSEHPDNVPVEPGEGEMVEAEADLATTGNVNETVVEGESPEPEVASEQPEAEPEA